MAKKAAKNCQSTKELANKLGVGSDCGTCLMGALKDMENNLSIKKHQQNYCQISQKAS
jgi:bacterioferritin-associated ferredoxin